MSRARWIIALAVLLASSPRAAAQNYRWEQIDELGIRVQVRDELARVPLSLDASEPELRARFKPLRQRDYIRYDRAAYVWCVWVYEFELSEVESTLPIPGSTDGRATNFAEFVHRPGTLRDFDIEGEPNKANRAAGKKLPYTWWEYSDTETSQLGAAPQAWQMFAAVYDLDGREVAVVAGFPLTKKGKLPAKYRQWAKKMLLSVSLADQEGSALTLDESLLEHADTPARRDAVARAHANIRELSNWAMFTTESYIVLYSWPNERADKRKAHARVAERIAEHMDGMQSIYASHHPPANATEFPYSIIRVCSGAEEFGRYGGTSRADLAGWYSPDSKELVVFPQEEMDRTRSVAAHEGWHQYSDALLGLPEGRELPIWLDEGAGDYFGSFTRRGGGWAYRVSKERLRDARTIVATETFIPLDEFITWSRTRFYGEDPSAHYAQGYAMFDFLMRGGDSGAKGWIESWGDILPRFWAVTAETADPLRATEEAFANVDWERLTRAWITWVKDY